MGRCAAKAAMTCGASLAAMIVYAGTAQAQQATPGSAQCPRTGNVVTCTGDVSGGFRSNNDATMRELRFRDLTQPVTGPIEVRQQNDLLFDLAEGVILNSTNPPPSVFPVFSVTSGRPEAPVFLQLDYTRNLTLNFRSAAEINASFDFAAPGTHTPGAIFIEARNVDLVNTGRITVTSPSYSGTITNIRGAPRAIQILNSDRATISNSGAMSLSGSAGALISAKSRDLSVTNSGALTLSGNDYQLRPFELSVQSTNAAAARIALTNSAAILSTATDFYGADERATSLLELRGRGTITVANSGTWTNAAMQVLALNENRTDDISISIENDGTLIGSGIQATAGMSCTTFCSVDDLIGDEVSVSLANRATLDKAPLRLFAQGDRAQALLTNSGNSSAMGPIRNDPNFTRGGSGLTYLLSATTDAAMVGSATTRLTNSGDLLMTDSRFGSLITASSSHVVEVANTGTLTARNMTGATGIQVRQGTHVYNQGPAVNADEYVFDLGTTVTNSGAMSLGGVGGDILGIWASQTYGEVAVTNRGAITVTNTADENFSASGMAFKGFSDMQLISAAPISATGTSGAAAGIFFGEISFSDRLVTAQAGHLRGYDRAADLASRVDIAAQADITASGLGGYGIFGLLGVTDNINDRRYATSNISPDTGTSDDAGNMTISNDRALAAIDVAAGVTVTGGTGSGSGIGVQGAGTVTVANAGTILGRGSAGSGGIVLGDLVTTTTFGGRVPERDANLSLNLVDSVNTGTIRSDLGYGIWAQTGAITNLVNRGTIHGGQASVASARQSNVSNEAGGIIDGRLLLTGAGSSLVNAGTLRATSPGAALHELNGNYSQSAAGTLALRQDVGDRMNVAGNLALNGNLDLTLGAPTGNAIVTVGGNLILDGTLNVTAGAGFGGGTYRLFNYAGTLTDNGLELGGLPGGTSGNLQTLFAGQVNLVVGGSSLFWDGSDTVADGTIDGGSGTWNSSTTNWTRSDGTVNEAWGNQFAIFQGPAGTVTIASGGVTASGLQFAVNGYRIEGGPLTLTSPSTLRVGDGSSAGGAMTGTIASTIAGAGGIDKTDLGTLVLTGANSFSGGVRVSGGTLQIGADSALGAAQNVVTLDGGALRLSAALTSARGFSIGAGGGTLDMGANALTLTGAIGGAGTLTKTGSGTLTLSGNSQAFTGATRV
ncbi:MAG TPA: autotransporter-associated beta strand repeat-containing protein, partial [Allosphingosinicella sp.]